MINRLKLMKIYMAGNMDHDRVGGRVWREDMEEWLFSRSAIPLNPYHKPVHGIAEEDDDQYNRTRKAIIEGRYEDARQSMIDIVHIDLRMVDSSDALIVNINLDKRPCGSWDEIFMAASQNKPVLIHCAQGIRELPNWLFGRLPHELFFDSWNDMKTYLAHIDNDDIVDTVGRRWKFFDYSSLVERALRVK